MENIEIKNYTHPEELPDKNQHIQMPRHPFRLLIVGPSGCGKTNLVINLIEGFKKPKGLKLDFDKFYLCAKDINEPKYATLYDNFTMFDGLEKNDIIKSKKLKKDEKNKLLEWYEKYKKQDVLFSSDLKEFITVHDMDRSSKKLVIFDDCITEKDQRICIDLFIMGRKKNASNIYLAQNYYAIPKDIRKNCTHCIFFELSPRDIRMINIDIDPNFQNMYKNKKVFFMLDLVNPKMRYRNGFKPISNNQYE